MPIVRRKKYGGSFRLAPFLGRKKKVGKNAIFSYIIFLQVFGNWLPSLLCAKNDHWSIGWASSFFLLTGRKGVIKMQTGVIKNIVVYFWRRGPHRKFEYLPPRKLKQERLHQVVLFFQWNFLTSVKLTQNILTKKKVKKQKKIDFSRNFTKYNFKLAKSQD